MDQEKEIEGSWFFGSKMGGIISVSSLLVSLFSMWGLVKSITASCIFFILDKILLIASHVLTAFVAAFPKIGACFLYSLSPQIRQAAPRWTQIKIAGVH